MNNDMKADFEARAATFPCMFSKNPLRGKERIRAIKIKLATEFEADDDPPEETIVKLNFSTWIEFKTGDYKDAKDINERALVLSERKNITSLVCQAHILWHDGDEREAGECLNEAEHLRNGRDGELMMSKVEAELAYCYSRLGGSVNLARAIDLYGRVIERHPEVYLWKFGLGLTHRRATHGNLHLATSPRRTVEEHAKIAAELLYDVTNGSLDNRLKGRAFSQLAVMRSHADILLSPLDCKEIFGDVDFTMLIDKALDCCSNDALTLSECGRILRFTNLERGTSLLERALDIKKHSTTYHQLGMCYERMAKNRAQKNVKMVPRPVEMREMTLGGTRGKNFNKNNTYRQQGYSSFNEATPRRFPDGKPTEKHSEYLPKQPSGNLKSLTHPHQFFPKDTHDWGRPQNYTATTYTPKRDQGGISYQKQRNGGIFVRSPAKEVHLWKDDDLVVKALDCYREAIKLSREGNIPALYSLGLLLRTCGQLDLALKQFNKIIHQTTDKNPVTEYFITLTSAYEQAGLCLLDLAKQPGTTDEQIQKLNEDAETKLMKAVSLSSILANLDPEMKRYEKQVGWTAFKTLEIKYEEIKDSPKGIKKHIELLKRVGQYERIPPVITKLRLMSEDELNDPSVFQSAIESYLKSGLYEDAYNFAFSAPSAVVSTDPLKVLVLKVKLHAAAARLVSRELRAAQLILRVLFLSCFERPQNETNPSGRDDDNPDPSEEAKEILDVLIVYDINHEDTGSHFWEKVNKLQVILSGEFGLAVDTIEERPDAGKFELSQHVEEIIAAKVVLILLRGEPGERSSLFTRVLEYIPIITMDCQTNGLPEPHIVLGLADDGVKVDRMLMRFMQIDVVDLLGRINVTADEDVPEQLQDQRRDQAVARCLGAPEMRHDDVNDCHTDQVRGPAMGASPVNTRKVRECPVSVSSDQAFDDSVNAKMSLFCALIKKQWPV